MKKEYLNRRNVLDKAVHDCYKEMYAKAQPSADWDQIIKEFKEGKRNKNERVYEQHYLSQEEYQYIVDKYIDAYNIASHWNSDIEVLEEYLTKGGTKDKYIEDKYNENGELIECGHRGYEKVAPLKEHIKEIIYNEYDENVEITNNVTEKVTNKVMELISTCKDFYRFDREESSFRITTALGASPTSNSETVKRYWKEKIGEDINIEIRNPKLFWYIDNGYTDEDLAYEFEDYGENWKEALDKEWKNELERREQEKNERLNRLTAEIKKNKNEEA